MNLALDFGNTFIKAGLFKENELIEVVRLTDLTEIDRIIANFRPRHIIVSSVSRSIEEIKPQLKDIPATILRPDLPLPFKINYKTPQTLGLDRIAAVSGAQGIFPDTNCLVIDTGTCFTYDFIDSAGTYHGGGISPGISLRFKALHTFTANLPLIEFEKDVPLVGQSTKGSILSGVVNGTIAEIQEIIRMYSDKFGHLQIIICGGDAKFFENKLKASIFVAPELVLRGLNRILLYNA
ncbi:type III pantothenate kinase [Fulvivirga kasyanovii]|uniref:Type III pantothenate kinase n=1 Tax=Fulvivirga kasyanovii TaxID=396812 RepID=A0ABW9RM35_9BACT|nr:type III pantothenate kinase [Fulvivirga kasyanovii]MTI25011.1 type III pantothenate kinase [Fulvivirga kasyanovii]